MGSFGTYAKRCGFMFCIYSYHGLSLSYKLVFTSLDLEQICLHQLLSFIFAILSFFPVVGVKDVSKHDRWSCDVKREHARMTVGHVL